MPRISTIRPDIVAAVADSGTWMTLGEIVDALNGKYSREQIYDAMKWLLLSGELQAEKQPQQPGGRVKNNRYLAPTRLRPNLEVGFDHDTLSLSRRHSFDLSGVLGWQLQVQQSLCRRSASMLAASM